MAVQTFARSNFDIGSPLALRGHWQRRRRTNAIDALPLFGLVRIPAGRRAAGVTRARASVNRQSAPAGSETLPPQWIRIAMQRDEELKGMSGLTFPDVRRDALRLERRATRHSPVRRAAAPNIRPLEALLVRMVLAHASRITASSERQSTPGGRSLTNRGRTGGP